MPRRSDPRNPLVINSNNEFTEVGYLTGGTPMPVNIVAGVITGANPTAGTLNEVYKIGTVYAGSICVTSGTVAANPTMGTLNTVTQIGTLPTLGTMGTLYYVTGLGMGTVRVESGTVRVDMGTIGISASTLGTVNVFTKHDLHAYHSISTLSTTIGSIAQTTNKVIYVHYYHLQTDGTWGVSWVDNKNGGGTVDYGWVVNQREGVSTAFAPYPGYIFKTLTAGSALLLGTHPAFPCVGTLRATIVYTDDDAS